MQSEGKPKGHKVNRHRDLKAEPRRQPGRPKADKEDLEETVQEMVKEEL